MEKKQCKVRPSCDFKFAVGSILIWQVLAAAFALVWSNDVPADPRYVIKYSFASLVILVLGLGLYAVYSVFNFLFSECENCKTESSQDNSKAEGIT